MADRIEIFVWYQEYEWGWGAGENGAVIYVGS